MVPIGWYDTIERKQLGLPTEEDIVARLSTEWTERAHEAYARAVKAGEKNTDKGARMKTTTVLPDDSAARKTLPITTGVLDYFPGAIAAVAEVSRVGNEKHNPGEALHWARGKSTDHADCINRHLIDRGKKDSEGIRHSAYTAWRALALLQEELEADGATPGRGSVFPVIEDNPNDALTTGELLDKIERDLDRWRQPYQGGQEYRDQQEDV